MRLARWSARRSAVRQPVFLDSVAVGLEHHLGAAVLADLLGGSLDHAVALARLSEQHLAGGGYLEALFCARLRLKLGHLALLIPTWTRPIGRGPGIARLSLSSIEQMLMSVPREHFAAATAAL